MIITLMVRVVYNALTILKLNMEATSILQNGKHELSNSDRTSNNYAEATGSIDNN